jgi:hypothetical protein
VHQTDELLLAVGGRWDRLERRFDGDAETALVLYLVPSQLEAARWFARWLRGYLTGQHDPDTDRIWSVLLAGDRGAGKGFFALAFLVAFLAANDAGAIVWVVSSLVEKQAELRRELDEMIPSEWAEWNEVRKCYHWVNGGELHLKSSHKPGKLKQGRVDVALFNEAQEQSQVAYAMVRPRIADTGGLVILGANSPNLTIGQWVLDAYEDAKAGRRRSRLFEMSRKLNPFVRDDAIEDMKGEVDELTYRRDVLNEWLPIGDKAFYAWSQRHNVMAIPPGLVDVTFAFTARKLGRGFKDFIGADFQRRPHQAAVWFRAFQDPEDPGGEPLLWVVGYFALEQSSEDELIDALEGAGLNRADTGCIMDKSGDWQNADRTKGWASWDMFRARGWHHLINPDPDTAKNPDLLERFAVANARIKDANGKQHVYSIPENEMLNRAIRDLDNKNGIPNRRSSWAHLGDAFSYPLYRLYPRKAPREPFTFKKLERPAPRSFGGFR